VDERPLWRRLFDAVDSDVGPRLEELVRTEQFADAMALMNRLNRQAVKMATDINRRMLEFWNVPSRGELADLRKQVAAMDRQLHTMSKALEEARRGDH
jgi:hypothetical protein